MPLVAVLARMEVAGVRIDEDLLRAMADAGRGGTYYVETVDQASGIFEEELEGLLSLAAQNVRVQVTPGEDADFVRVLHDYPSHADGNILIEFFGQDVLIQGES